MGKHGEGLMLRLLVWIAVHIARWIFGLAIIAIVDVTFASVLKEWTSGFLYGVWGIWTACCILCAALKCDRK